MARTEELGITAGQVTLSGTLTMPDPPARAAPPGQLGSADRWPAVLLLPSWLPRDRHGRLDRRRHRGWFVGQDKPAGGILARLAVALAARGVASLRYDKRGCGRSGGSWSTAGLFTLVDDARDALAVLRGHPAIDPTRVGIAGHGEGAWIGLSVAAADPAVGPLSLIGAPARGWRDVFRRGVAERARRALDGAPEPAHPFVIGFDRALEEILERADRGEERVTVRLPGRRRVTLGLAAWEQGTRISSRALATLQRRSVTLIHGTRDAWVDPDESLLLEVALRPAAAPLRIAVPGAGHDLREVGGDVFRDLASDLAARLQPRRLPTVLLAITEPPEAGR